MVFENGFVRFTKSTIKKHKYLQDMVERNLSVFCSVNKLKYKSRKGKYYVISNGQVNFYFVKGLTQDAFTIVKMVRASKSLDFIEIPENLISFFSLEDIQNSSNKYDSLYDVFHLPFESLQEVVKQKGTLVSEYLDFKLRLISKVLNNNYPDLRLKYLNDNTLGNKFFKVVINRTRYTIIIKNEELDQIYVANDDVDSFMKILGHLNKNFSENTICSDNNFANLIYIKEMYFRNYVDFSFKQDIKTDNDLLVIDMVFTYFIDDIRTTLTIKSTNLQYSLENIIKKEKGVFKDIDEIPKFIKTFEKEINLQ